MVEGELSVEVRELFVEVRWVRKLWVWNVWLEGCPMPVAAGITAFRWGAYRQANRAVGEWRRREAKE